MVRCRRHTGAATVSRAHPEPGQHADRCRNRRPGCGAGAHHACGLGSRQRAPGEAVRAVSKTVEDVLDRLSEGGFGKAEDRDVCRLAAGRSRRRQPPSEETFRFETAVATTGSKPWAAK